MSLIEEEPIPTSPTQIKSKKILSSYLLIEREKNTLFWQFALYSAIALFQKTISNHDDNDRVRIDGCPCRVDLIVYSK